MSDIHLSIVQALDKFGLAQASTVSLLHRACLIVTSAAAAPRPAAIGAITMIRINSDRELILTVDSFLDIICTTKGADNWILCQIRPRNNPNDWQQGHFKLLDPSV